MTDIDVAARVRAAWADVLADDQQAFLAGGGHSLAAARLIVRLREELQVDLPMSAILRDDPTMAELVEVVRARLAAPRTAAALPPRPVSNPSSSAAPLAPTLRRIWAWHRLYPDSPAYNVVRVLAVAGRVEPAPLRAALADLGARHEALRCAVVEQRPGEPEIVVHDRVAAPLSVEVLRQASVEEALYRIADRPFPLAKAPLWRVGAVHEPARDRTWLVLVMHHLISDLRSSDIVLNDLALAYRARAAGEEPSFAAPAPSLLAHLAFEAQVPGTPRWSDDLDWWSRRLSETAPAGPLPLTAAHREEHVFAGATHSVELPAGESDALDRRLRAQGLTPAVFFLTTAGAVLAAWTGTDRAEVLGLPSVRMSRAEDERLVGFLLDTLPLPVTLDRAASFLQSYEAVRDAFADAADHALPVFDAIVDRARVPRAAAGRTPLIRLWFNDLTQAAPPRALGDLPVTEYDLPPAWALFDLGLYVRRSPDGYRLHLVTPRGLFDSADTAAFLDQIVGTAVRAGTDPARPIGAVLAPPDAATAAAADIPAVTSTVDLVDQHSRERAAATALADREGDLDYASLHRRIDDLAAHLRDTAGPHAVVALPARRDRLFVLRLLACRRAGAEAVLVDAGWPAWRRRRAMEIAAVTHAFPSSGEGPAAPVDAGREGGGHHVLFTSGTSGDPLAVRVPTAVADAALADLAERLGMTADDRVSMLSGPGHDPVLRDLGLALRVGATICVPPPEVIENPGRLAAWLRRERVTVVNATPVMLALALSTDPEPLPDLRAVVCGGSPLSTATAELIRSRAGRAVLLNGYGCTETPQLVTAYEIGPDEPLPLTAQVPIGEPLPGRRVELRDPDGRRCAAGRLGEVWVAAPHIAEGYCGGTGADRFTTDADGLRWLRTGDLARLDAAGRLHLAGRTDRQVLLNGHRVTLEEIESVARGCPGVAEAIAQVVGDDTQQSLRVWVQRSATATLTEADVRARLATVLPATTVPARVHVVDRLAVTPNLKPAVPGQLPPPAAHRTERRLQELASSMLGRPIDPATNFFDAGFTSISLLQMCAELTDLLGRPVEPLHVFERPNLASLSLFLFGPDDPAAAPPPPPAAPPPNVERSARLARMRSTRRQVRSQIREL
ncbi:acyl carrier protein [Micromonospora chokoriensis]|uniref:acyl carrier protein n=1 Tax=Micromonospora chokoriensis TaxID=356851 RepID=UPI00068EB2D6|nr:acyl carrier protein [Micromonospora chokoriensis]